jgi:hypothetical protein
VFAYFATQLTQQLLWNTAFHAGTTLKWRTYSPGLVTALAGFLPAWFLLSRRARRQALIAPKMEVLAGVLGGAIHGAAVAGQVFGAGPFGGKRDSRV